MKVELNGRELETLKHSIRARIKVFSETIQTLRGKGHDQSTLSDYYFLEYELMKVLLVKIEDLIKEDTPQEKGERTVNKVSACCKGEKCVCGKPAAHKVSEVVQFDDPLPDRHPLTSYLCQDCFRRVMGPAAGGPKTQPVGKVYRLDYRVKGAALGSQILLSKDPGDSKSVHARIIQNHDGHLGNGLDSSVVMEADVWDPDNLPPEVGMERQRRLDGWW